MVPSLDVPRTMLHVLRDQARALGERPALWSRRDGVYRPTSWRAYHDQVRQVASGLEALGFGPGSALCILSFNREEWLFCDLAAMGLGGVAVGLYTTSSDEQLQYVISHCEATVLVVENRAYADRVAKLRPLLPALQHVVLLEGAATEVGEVSFADLLRMGQGRHLTDWDRRLDALDPEGLATLIYTSGTTGHPKGVMLSHRNLCWTAVHLSQAAETGPADVLLSYLPLSHIAEQTCSLYAPLLTGIQVYFAASLESVPKDLVAVRPTVFFGVPRVWEKLKARLEEGIGQQSPRRRALVAWARRVGLERTQRVLRHERPPLVLEAQYTVAAAAVFAPLRARIGLSRARLLATSAAPIGRDVLDFFASLDMVLREVYGQSEVTGPTSISTPDHTRLGRVGRPMLGVEVRIADDGEVLVRGQNVCLGYFKDEAATAELIKDGWLHSGDLGELDQQGFLRITGRKKELIVTSGGKKTAPSHIEALLRAIPPLGNACVLGDGRNYLSALLPLDPGKVPAFARARGLPSDPVALAADPAMRRYLEERLEKDVNARLARFEHIRRFELLPEDFSVEGGELTPTLKVRRKVVEQKHQDAIARLYPPEPARAAGQ
jgi:long-chain acyl-CoA synthetase